MSNLRVTYKDVSPEAKELSTNTFDDIQGFANIEQIKIEKLNVPRYITLEDKLVALDDNNKFMDDQDEIFGYISKSMSDENGKFNEPIQLIRTFSEKVSSVGVTFTFSEYFNNYCNSLKIEWYEDDELIAEENFTPNNYMYYCSKNVEYFNKQVITFNSTNNPYRYLKIAEIEDGATRIFEDDEIRNLKIIEELNPISEEVSINTMTLNFDNKNDIEYMFQQKQPMQVEFKDKLVGIFYIEKATQKSAKQFTLQLEDYLGILDKTVFYGGMYQDVTVENIVSSIMENEKFEYSIEEELKSIVLNGYLPICTKREALQQVAFAISAVIDTSRTNKINIFTLKEDDELIEVSESNTYLGATYTTEDVITRVKLNEHKYVASNETNELFNDILDGTIILEFSEPYHDLNISGGTIDESGTNYAVITGTGATVILNGAKYIHTMICKEKKNSKIIAGTLANEVSYENATLVSSNNSESVLNNVSSYLFKRDKLEVQLELENNEGTGDRLSITTEYKGQKNARIESVDVDLRNKFIGKVVATIE